MFNDKVLKLNICELKRSVAEALRTLGYTALSGGEDTAPPAVHEYPCGKVAPLEITSIDGRNEGLVTCGLRLRLAALPPSPDPAAAEQLEESLLGDAALLYSIVNQGKNVCHAGRFSCAPDRTHQSPHGETAVKVSFEIGFRVCFR